MTVATTDHYEIRSSPSFNEIKSGRQLVVPSWCFDSDSSSYLFRVICRKRRVAVVTDFSGCVPFERVFSIVVVLQTV